MTLPAENESVAAASSARLLYRLYKDLAREYMIDLPACGALESAQEATPESVVAEARTWLADADQRIPVHQLRQFLQTSKLANQESLLAALNHYLHKTERGAADRDKLDYLLVQFFATCSASQLQDAEASLDFVARTLEPVLGTVEVTLTESLHQLGEILASAAACGSLQELFGSGVLNQGRSLKIACGDQYFEASSLVAFTRFNFLLRRVFFRLLHQDLNSILEGLRELEQRGVQTLDCRSAEFSSEESVARLRMICQSWKMLFQAEYSSGQPLRLLVDLRTAVDAELARVKAESAGEQKNPPLAKIESVFEKQEPPRAKAAAASAGSSASNRRKRRSSHLESSSDEGGKK